MFQMRRKRTCVVRLEAGCACVCTWERIFDIPSCLMKCYSRENAACVLGNGLGIINAARLVLIFYISALSALNYHVYNYSSFRLILYCLRYIALRDPPIALWALAISFSTAWNSRYTRGFIWFAVLGLHITNKPFTQSPHILVNRTFIDIIIVKPGLPILRDIVVFSLNGGNQHLNSHSCTASIIWHP